MMRLPHSPPVVYLLYENYIEQGTLVRLASAYAYRQNQAGRIEIYGKRYNCAIFIHLFEVVRGAERMDWSVEEFLEECMVHELCHHIDHNWLHPDENVSYTEVKEICDLE